MIENYFCLVEGEQSGYYILKSCSELPFFIPIIYWVSSFLIYFPFFLCPFPLLYFWKENKPRGKKQEHNFVCFLLYPLSFL